MIWVWVLVEGNWQDYEGGGDEILAIYASDASAWDELRRLLVVNGAPDVEADPDGCFILEDGPSKRWLQIQKWAVS